MGKRGTRFEVVHWLACIRREGGLPDVKKGGGGRVLTVKTINICVRLIFGLSNTSLRLLSEPQVLVHRQLLFLVGTGSCNRQCLG